MVYLPRAPVVARSTLISGKCLNYSRGIPELQLDPFHPSPPPVGYQNSNWILSIPRLLPFSAGFYLHLLSAPPHFLQRRPVSRKGGEGPLLLEDLDSRICGRRHIEADSLLRGGRFSVKSAGMSFVFRGSRADIESGFPGFIPERRVMRMHPGVRPVNMNSMAFLTTVVLLFLILNTHQMSSNFLLWLVLGIFLTATALRMYATCQQLQAQAHAVAASGLLGHTELRLHVPPSIALATRGRLQSLRLQLALLDREFDDLDYDALRALDAESPELPSMSEEEINALPVHKYKAQLRQDSASSRQSDRLSQQQASSSSGSITLKKQDNSKEDGCIRDSDDELTCSVCLEQVVVGELIRSLPCLHQFHASCIDPWLRQQGTCPVCKHRAGGGWHGGAADGEIEMDASYMV